MRKRQPSDRQHLTSFCQVFNDELARLFSLALLLTADPVKAERCFISSLNDCACFPPLEKERVLFWSKRFIMHNAIRPIGGAFEDKKMSTIKGNVESTKPPALLSALAQLPRFERFVFVMSILEGLEDDEICSFLKFEGLEDEEICSFLKCGSGDIAAARERALCALSGFDVAHCVSASAIRDQNGNQAGANAIT
jgi:hypothetical protein